MRPMTLISSAIFETQLIILFCKSWLIEKGGNEQALSPEWIPASSMCSIMPAMNISPLVSLIKSTSTSIEFSRYWSTKIVLFDDASSAFFVKDSRCFSLYAISIALPPKTYDGLISIG